MIVRSVGYSASLTGFVLALAGREKEALRMREELLEHRQRGEADAYEVALQFVGADQLDEACVWLNPAVEDRSFNGMPAAPAHNQIVGPLFAHVRHDARFDDLMRRLRATHRRARCRNGEYVGAAMRCGIQLQPGCRGNSSLS